MINKTRQDGRTWALDQLSAPLQSCSLGCSRFAAVQFAFSFRWSSRRSQHTRRWQVGCREHKCEAEELVLLFGEALCMTFKKFNDG